MVCFVFKTADSQVKGGSKGKPTNTKAEQNKKKKAAESKGGAKPKKAKPVKFVKDPQLSDTENFMNRYDPPFFNRLNIFLNQYFVAAWIVTNSVARLSENMQMSCINSKP